MAVDHVVRVRRPEGQWVTLGTEEARGVVPEGLAMSADLQGPSSCSFTLKRPADVVWSELQAANQVQVDVDGVPVWGGRINQTPAAGKGVGEQISVSAQGWVSHLSDDLLDMGWVLQSTGVWVDQRTVPTADLTRFTTTGTVQTGQQPSFGWGGGAIVATSNLVGITADAGANRTFAGAMIWFDMPTNRGTEGFYIRGAASAYASAAVSPSDVIANIPMSSFAATGNVQGSAFASGPRRYAHLFVIYPGAGGTWGSGGCTVTITAAKLYARTRDNTTLFASDIVRDALTSGTAPLLAADLSGVQATQFNIPEFWPDGLRTAREIIEAVNAYHDYLWGVDALRRPYWRARPTEPAYEVGSFSGGQFDDTSLGNLERIYNRVYVDYTDPSGAPQIATRSNPSTILTRQGFTRGYRLTVQSVLTAAAANQIGDVWLTKHADAPLAGSITVSPGDIRTTQGVPVHPSILLTKTGERLRLTGQIDPVTGAVGRVGTIVSVSYSPATETAQLQLDNDTQSLEAWLARLALIQGAGR